MYIALNLITGHEDGGYPNKAQAKKAGEYLQEQFPYLGEWRVFKVRDGYFKSQRNKEFWANNDELLTEINKLLSFCPTENIQVHQPTNKLTVVPPLKSAAEVCEDPTSS